MTTKTQQLVTLSDAQNRLAEQLDLLAESGLACRDLKAGFSKALLTAVCVDRLKAALTEQVMQPIMALQDSALGFRTDKEKQGGYPLPVVKEALINAVMVGLLPCGNQWNIIDGRMYVTKEGFTYLLDQAGVKYTIDQAVPVMKNGGAIVHTEVAWSDPVTGSKGSKVLEIPVRVNAGMGTDAILGKADRKAKCWLYNNLTHSTLADGEAPSERFLDAPVVDSGSGGRATVAEPSFLEGAKRRSLDAPVTEQAAAAPARLQENPAKPDEIPGVERTGDVPPFGEVVKG